MRENRSQKLAFDVSVVSPFGNECSMFVSSQLPPARTKENDSSKGGAAQLLSSDETLTSTRVKFIHAQQRITSAITIKIQNCQSTATKIET